MEENLKTVRTAHRVLVIAATILFIYGMSITPYRNRYEEALIEFGQMDTAINRLVALQDKILTEHIENSVYADTVDHFLEGYGYGDQVGRIIFEQNYGLRKLKQLPLPKIVDYFCSPNSWGIRAPKIDGSDIKKAKVYSIFYFLDSCMNSTTTDDYKVGIPLLGLFFNIFEDSATLTGVYGKTGVQHTERRVIPIHGTVHTVNPHQFLDYTEEEEEEDEDDEEEDSDEEAGGEPDLAADDSLAKMPNSDSMSPDSISDSLDEYDPACPPQFDLTYLQSVGDNHTYVQNVDEEGVIVDYLKTQKFTGEIDESGNYANSLPHIRGILPELKDLEYKNISNFLKNKADILNETQRSYLEISGLKLPREIAGIGGPAILLFIFLELLSHLIQLNKIKDTHLNTIATFPWIGIHTNGFGQLITFLSLTVLVPVSCVLPIAKSGYAVEIRSWLIIGYVLLFEVLASIVLRKLYWIRKTLPVKE